MTTPIVEITPTQSVNYMWQFGNTIDEFTNNVGTINASQSIELMWGSKPLRIIIDTSGQNYAGIFSGMPNTASCKLVSATVRDATDDDIVDVITDRVIMSTDGMCVFKPNFTRMINDVLPDITSPDKYYIEVEIEATPAYTNPSGATPAYTPTVLKFKIELGQDTTYEGPYNTIDEIPYIVYTSGTEGQPAI